MGNSICPNGTEQTHISSHFDLNRVSQKQNNQNQQPKLTDATNTQQLDPKNPSKNFNPTQNQPSNDKQNICNPIKQKAISLRSTQLTEFSRNTPTKSIANTQKLIVFKNDANFPLQNVAPNKQQNFNNFQPISVTFSVIYLLLTKKMINAIQKNNPSFFKKYENDIDSFTLFLNGCYGHILNQNYGIFINYNYFYEGYFNKNENGEFQPSLKGTYITQDGKYIGEFKEGKPYGKGKYSQFTKMQDSQNNYSDKFLQTPKSQNSIIKNSQSRMMKDDKIYEGLWKNGELLEGKIQSSSSKYQGSVKNGRPEGEGKLFLKQSEITYKGDFKNGMFDGIFCVYETPNFVYHGDFKRGKKQGYGILTKKIVITKSSSPRTKYFDQQRYEGVWKDDILIQEQYIGHRKRQF